MALSTAVLIAVTIKSAYLSIACVDLSSGIYKINSLPCFSYPSEIICYSTPLIHLDSLGENFLVNNCGMYDSF